MMEFEEIQKIWNEQKGETMYAIDENALHKSVTRKKNAATRRINKVEIMLMLVNSLGVIFLSILMYNHPRIWGFINMAILATSVVYVLYFRRKRIKAENMFDRSLLGELNHAISSSKYMIKFNRLVFLGYLIPLSVVGISALIFSGASLKKWLITSGMLLLCLIVVRWEQKKCNIPKNEQLIALKKKLTES